MGLIDLIAPSRRQRQRAARAAYGSVMSAALRPALYEAGLGEDTLEGRFEQVAVHGTLFLRRLRSAGDGGTALAEALQAQIFSGFDHALRETGTGDTTISRKVRGLGERFYGLARSFDAALTAGGTGPLEDVIRRNGLAHGHERQLAVYILAAETALQEAPDGQILAGQANWPVL